MKLVYLGAELNSNIEHELRNDFPFGVDAVIIGTDGRVEVRNNCTEVHHRFERAGQAFPDGIAFESDIHMTGGVRELKDIATVVISKAAERSESY